MTSPLDFLPHKPPMRLVETVKELVGGERATGGRRADPGDFYFDGHFPDDPVVPAVILVELLAQVGGLAAGTPADGVSTPPLRLHVAGLGPFKFPGTARAGEWLEAHARVAGRLGTMYKVEGQVTSDGRIVAAGSVTLAGAPESAGPAREAAATR
jgi:3-hydroxyacyl-[acyl-carrier-protein] dehydratase